MKIFLPHYLPRPKIKSEHVNWMFKYGLMSKTYQNLKKCVA